MILVLQEQSQQVLCFQYSNASKELNSRGSKYRGRVRIVRMLAAIGGPRVH